MAWQRKGTTHTPRSDRFKRPYQRARESRTPTQETVHEPSINRPSVRNDHSVERVNNK